MSNWPPKSTHAFDGQPATFTDAVGSTDAVLSNDGSRVHLKVLGASFTSECLDDFAAVDDGPIPSRLLLHKGGLCGYTLDFQAPMTLAEGSKDVSAVLRVCVKLGTPAERGNLSHESVQLRLSFDGVVEHTTKQHGLFESALDELREHLPPGSRLKCCLGCDFSDYSPYGNGLFGTLYCFRTVKDRYRRVASKGDIFDLWDEAAGAVQETWLCDEWEARAADRGYRG